MLANPVVASHAALSEVLQAFNDLGVEKTLELLRENVGNIGNDIMEANCKRSKEQRVADFVSFMANLARVQAQLKAAHARFGGWRE